MSLILQSPAPGSACPYAGTEVQAGLDLNGDGVLEASEVTSVSYVCDGTPGEAGVPGSPGATGATGASGATGATGAQGEAGSQVQVTPEPAGPNCATGGERIDIGTVVDAGFEVQETAYVCNGTSAAQSGTEADAESDAPTSEGSGALRLIAPLSSTMVTVRMPVFKWSLGAAFDSGRVQVCSDVACTSPVASFTGTSSAIPTENLPVGPLYWRVYGRLGSNEAVQPTGVWEVFVPMTSAPHEASPRLSHDLNGDGLADFVISDFGTSSGTPVANVFLGRSPAPSTAATSVLYDGQDQEGRGLASGEFANSVSIVGDVDGDGFADMSVGISDFEPGSSGLPGGVIYWGSPSAPDNATNSPVYGADDFISGSRFDGYGVGDVNGDGFAEAASLHLGSLQQPNLFVTFGRSTRFPVAPPPVLANQSLVAQQEDSFIDANVTSIGDVNGDGYADVAIAYPGEVGVGVGRVDIALGGPAGLGAPTSLVGSGVTESQFGLSVAGGDVDGDGYGDVLVAAPGEANGSGQVYLFRGTALGIQASPAWTFAGGVGSLRLLGSADFNGDGYDDLVVVQQLEGKDLSNDTQLLTFNGNPSTFLSGPTTLTGLPAGVSSLGASLDLNGDGFGDVVVGLESLGEASILFGSSAGLTTSGSLLVGPRTGNTFGEFISN